MPIAAHVVNALFLLALGTCVGSFLNVVVWRLPRVEHRGDENLFKQLGRSLKALSDPPSHCPACNHPIRWYDNLPVFGWLKLGGKCRDCRSPISMRYPIIEAITGILFLGYYLAFHVLQTGMLASPVVHWGHLLIVLAMASALLAASLIDAELFIIPSEIPWLVAAIGLVGHGIVDRAQMPASLLPGPLATAFAAGAGIGLILSIAFLAAGVLGVSFPSGEPMEEQDRIDYAREVAEARKLGKALPEVPPTYTRGGINREIVKELLFLAPPMLLGLVGVSLAAGPLRQWWGILHAVPFVHGFLGALLGAMVGGGIVWFFRIAGTLAMGRVAMGLGDVHLLFAVGAVIGAGPVVIVFFLAPFAGLAVGLGRLISGGRHEMPYGPYLAAATGVVLLIYPAFERYFNPGLRMLGELVSRSLYGG